MEKKYIVGGAAALGLILFLMYRKRTVYITNVTAPEKDIDISGMNIPGYQGGDFISNITVEANPSLLSMLNNKFMPLFGFVGTTTIGVPVYLPAKKPVRRYYGGGSMSSSPGKGTYNDAKIRSA